ncbi:O-methyltransferase mpaG' [Cladobotryum mycophilum]|uniref:O-methyltransferase mpaG n=1 Tax=Cladobotryum mycophilum TaxID=491253 RepID=A0ABR0S6S3_9HYPO
MSSDESTVALMPNGTKEHPSIIKETLEYLNAYVQGKDVNRHDLIAKCQSLVHGLETPRETMIRHCWSQPGTIAAISFGVSSGLWTLMAKNGTKSQRVSDLAASLAVDPNLLRRLMRHLAAVGYLVESNEDEYTPTDFSTSLSIPIIGNGYIAATSCIPSSTAKFNEFSRERGWKNPSDASDTAFMYALGTDKDMFTWLNCQGYGPQFNDLMIGYHLGRKSWMSPEVYPVQERLIDGAIVGDEAPLLVDIGGNIGHDLLQFKQRFPNAPGRLILQDLPAVIGQIQDLDSSIIRMEHDFNNEQPVKGARAYYLRSILHDWPDDTCVIILNNIKEAMKQGYSKLLINENVMPSVKARWEATCLDMMMLTLLSSEERTEGSWRNLIEGKAGLKILRIWNDGSSAESLIECEL